ncbi:MAG TPA: hypothetical protein VGP72_04355 [Planctomycetota bacterium]|jgi:hypothetical protein
MTNALHEAEKLLATMTRSETGEYKMPTFPIWTPYNAFEAASVLQKILHDQKSPSAK